MLLFILFSHGQAQDSCLCQPVNCAPCQTELLVGNVQKKCSSGKVIQCNKIVCENVDNYFKCIAGSSPIYIPPKGITEVSTEPRYSNLEAPKSTDKHLASKPKGSHFDFDHFFNLDKKNQNKLAATTAVIARTPKKKAPRLFIKKMRQPASVKKVEKYSVGLIKGRLVNKKGQRVRRGAVFPFGEFVTAKKGSSFVISKGASRSRFSFKESSLVQLTKEQGYLVVNLKSGAVSLRQVNSWKKPLVVDLGDWRIGKNTGASSLSWQGKELWVQNSEGPMWLRRDQLISTVMKVDVGASFRIAEGRDLFGFNKIKGPEPKDLSTYKLVDNSVTTESRYPANTSSLCKSPSAAYQQCAWKCFGNKRESDCRANTKGLSSEVSCVRFSCTVDGQWKLPTRVSGSACLKNVTRIGRCY